MINRQKESSKDRVKRMSILNSQIISAQDKGQKLRSLRNRLKKIPQILHRISNSQQKHKEKLDQSALMIQKNIRGTISRERHKKFTESWDYMNKSVTAAVDTCESLFRKLFKEPVTTIQTAFRSALARSLVHKVEKEYTSRKISDHKKKTFIKNAMFKKNTIVISRDFFSGSRNNMRWNTFTRWWGNHRSNIPLIHKQKLMKNTSSQEDSSQDISDSEELDKFSETDYGESPRISLRPTSPQRIQTPRIYKVITLNHRKPTQSFLNNIFWDKEPETTERTNPDTSRIHKKKVKVRKKRNEFTALNSKKEPKNCKTKSKKVWVPCMVYTPQEPQPLPPLSNRSYKIPDFIGDFQSVQNPDNDIYPSFESDASYEEKISNNVYSKKIEVALPEIYKILIAYNENLDNN